MIIFKGGPLDGQEESTAGPGTIIIARWVGRRYRLTESTTEPLLEDDEE